MRPVPDAVSFDYGRRYRTGKKHRGVDFGCAYGSTVKAMRGGRVVHIGLGGWGPAYGLQVIVHNPNGEYDLYAHLMTTSVKVGASIKAGQVIAKSGGVRKYKGDKRAGNSTGPHLHVQTCTRYDHRANIDPWPAIRAAGKDWFSVALVNHAAATVALKRPGGWAKWLRRRTRLVNISIGSAGIHPAVLVGLECGGKLPFTYLTKKYAKHGMALVPNGGQGRNIWRDTKIVTKVLESGLIHTPKALRVDGDDQPAPYMVAVIDGTPGMVVGAHLDHKSDDNDRVNVALHIIDTAIEIAARHSIGRSRIVFAADTASESWVRDKAFGKRGFGAALVKAVTAVHAAIKSNNNWKPARVGPRVDDILTYNGANAYLGDDGPRPVDRAALHLDHIASDHHVQYARIGRQ